MIISLEDFRSWTASTRNRRRRKPGAASAGVRAGGARTRSGRSGEGSFWRARWPTSSRRWATFRRLIDNSKKVEAIKSLIASGAYPIDEHAVAAKMLALDLPARGHDADA